MTVNFETCIFCDQKKSVARKLYNFDVNNVKPLVDTGRSRKDVNQIKVNLRYTRYFMLNRINFQGKNEPLLQGSVKENLKSNASFKKSQSKKDTTVVYQRVSFCLRFNDFIKFFF